jgi:hypothetical protein
MEKDSRMTIEDLAALMEKRFAEQDKRFDEKFDTFAIIVAKSFAHVDEKIDTLKEEMDIKFEEVHENIGKVRNDLLNLDDRFVTHSEFNQFKLQLKSK